MKSITGIQTWILTWCVLAFMMETVLPAQISHPAGFLQVLRRLGENRSGAMKVSQGRNRSGESPIYYIRLPPTPYFYMPNDVLPSGVPHEKVPVDFTNNGRPNQVYHWNLPEMNSQVFQSSSPFVSSPVELPASYPVALPADFPAMLSETMSYESPAALPVMLPSAPMQATPSLTSSSPMPLESKIPASSSSEFQSIQHNSLNGMHQKKKPQTLKKDYAYNGKPTGVYIFKSKKPVYLEKYRRPLGKLLKF